MSRKPLVEADEREGLQVLNEYNGLEVTPSETSLAYPQRNADLQSKEAYVQQEYRITPQQDEVDGRSVRQQKRICGLRRRTAIICIAVTCLVVVAAVLAGTLATQLGGNGDDKSNT